MSFPALSKVHSLSDPDQHDDNVEALALAAVVLVGPHAVALFVPVSALCAVHAPSAHVRLSIGSGCGTRSGRVGSSCAFVLLGRGTGRGTLRFVERGSGDKVLDNRAVHGELEGWSTALFGLGLGYDGLKDIVLWE